MLDLKMAQVKLVVRECNMIAITEKEFEQFKLLKSIFMHLNPDKFEDVCFICGQSGSKDKFGLPDKLLVCPAYGLDGFAVYTKTMEYSAPGY